MKTRIALTVSIVVASETAFQNHGAKAQSAFFSFSRPPDAVEVWLVSAAIALLALVVASLVSKKGRRPPQGLFALWILCTLVVGGVWYLVRLLLAT